MSQGRPGNGLVAALAAAQVISWGTLYYAFPILVLPMRSGLGWPPGLLNGAVSAGLLAMGLASVPAGAWIDRHGGRGVMTLGSLLGAAGLGLWAWARTPALFVAAWLLLGAGMAGALYEPAFAVLTAAYGRDAPRRIAALTFAGGLASTLCMPAIQVLADALGWRGALWVLAGVNLAVCVPLHGLMVPGAAPVRAPGPAGPGPGRALVRSRPFWGLALGFPACTLVASALVFQLVPLLSGWGLAKGAVLACMMLIGPMQSASRLLWLALGGRLTARNTGLGVVAALLAGVLGLLLLPHRLAWLGAAVAVFGLGNGLLAIVRAVAVPELVGSEAYGTINGILALPVMVARAFGPAAAAALWAWTGGPAGMLWGLAGCALAGGVGLGLAAGGSGRGARAARSGNPAAGLEHQAPPQDPGLATEGRQAGAGHAKV